MALIQASVQVSSVQQLRLLFASFTAMVASVICMHSVCVALWDVLHSCESQGGYISLHKLIVVLRGHRLKVLTIYL